VSASVPIDARPDGIEAIGAALVRLRRLGESPRAIWEAIANEGEASTRRRFQQQRGPDGTPWKASKRVRKAGGLTLVHTARLLRSQGHTANASGGEWGTNVVYAGIHQFGGVIDKLAHSSWLRLRTDSAGRLLRQKDHAHLAVFAKATHKRATERRYTVGAHKINMPARPYLGVNEDDGRAMLQLANQVVDQAAANRGGAS
jgi:phage virion morphogenesis protein